MRKMNLQGKGVCTSACFTVKSLNKTSANNFTLVCRTLRVKSHLILHDELLKMPCATQHSVNTVLGAD